MVPSISHGLSDGGPSAAASDAVLRCAKDALFPTRTLFPGTQAAHAIGPNVRRGDYDRLKAVLTNCRHHGRTRKIGMGMPTFARIYRAAWGGSRQSRVCAGRSCVRYSSRSTGPLSASTSDASLGVGAPLRQRAVELRRQ